MDRKTSTDFMRLLHGELPEPEARQLRDRIENEPELKSHYEALGSVWQSLELPEPEPVPLGFASRVVASAKETEDVGLAPAWWTHTWAGKATTAMLLGGGIVFGAILASPGEADEWSDYLTSEPSMAETYILVMEEPEETTEVENGS